MSNNIQTLVGLIVPMEGLSGFAIPVFEDAGILYVQSIDDHKITAFERVELAEQRLLRTHTPRTASVGGPALYGFCTGPSDSFAATRTELHAALAGRMPEFAGRPFLRIDVAEFLGDENAKRKAVLQACDSFGQDESGAAALWREEQLGSINTRPMKAKPNAPSLAQGAHSEGASSLLAPKTAALEQDAGEAKAPEHGRANPITVLWGAGATAFAGYRTFHTFPELFWPTREKRSVLQITEKEEALLVRIHRTLGKHKIPTTLDSYLRKIDEYFSITEKLQSETIMRDDLDFNHPLLWSNVTDLSGRLTNLRKAICCLTVNHYADTCVELATKDDTLYEDCCNLVRFLKAVSDLQNPGNVSPSPVDIFTTNYDVLIEHLFWLDLYKDSLTRYPELHKLLSEWSLDNGFYVDKSTDGTIKKVECRAADNKLKINGCCPWYVADPAMAPNSKKLGEAFRAQGSTTLALRMNRLHGCVAWIRGNVAEKEIYFTLADPGHFFSFHDRLCVSYPGHEDSLGNPPHVDSWRRFLGQLNRSQICVIVGFAFRDPDILTAIGRRLEKANGDFRLIVINPRIPSLESLVERMIEACKDYCPPTPDWKTLLVENETIWFLPHAFPLQQNELKLLSNIASLETRP